MGLLGRERDAGSKKRGDTSETRRESDIQNGGEVKSHVTECRIIKAGSFKF